MAAQQPITANVLQQRLQQLRQEMMQQQLVAVLVRATDRYLSEYVAVPRSVRAFLTGFTGSVGDALITHKQAILFVDGRYQLQAQQQAPHFDVRVVTLGCSVEQAWLQQLAADTALCGGRLFVSADCLSMQLFNKLTKQVQQNQIEIVTEHSQAAQQQAAVWHKLWQNPPQPAAAVRLVTQQITGSSVLQRLAALRPLLQQQQLQGFFVAPLDAVAWLTNLRGSDFDSQAVLAAQAVLLHDKVLLAVQPQHPMPTQLEAGVHVVPAAQLCQTLQQLLGKSFRLGVDPKTTTQASAMMLQQAGAQLVPLASPIDQAKSIKTAQELRYMRNCIARADECVHKVQQWLCHEVMQGQSITEQDVGKRIRQEFAASGACDVSFAPICAAGEHAAVVHYTQLDDQHPIQPGQLFLMDVGALYDGGYATDLTRTFLVGNAAMQATPQQKQRFTTVLQAAINGMTARFPKGTSGVQLDALVRAALWQQGYNYAHGTGHGVGIHVHESPPRVSPAGHEPLQVGQVFSIEPGLYLPKWGGIRIENLCTLLDNPNHIGYNCVLPLSFAPLDERLIEMRQLTQEQQRFLRYFARCFALANDELPPLFEQAQP
ncbi:MAG: M24 family metallopeptidase [Myxococcota bacterium]